MSREIEEIRAEGYAKGRAKGYAKEYAEEYAEGYVEGYTEGYALEEKKEMANRLNDFGLPVEQMFPWCRNGLLSHSCRKNSR